MNSRKRGTTPSRDAVRRKRSVEDMDSIEVVCRLCPYRGSIPSLVAIDETAIQTIVPPPQYRREGAPVVEKVFTFGRVFSEQENQSSIFERTSIDLIVNLLRGQNSLLFTYGVTGSGKTFTMTGKPTENDTGILPRTLDVIFNSVANRVDKCIFYPSTLNSFDIRSTLDAHLKRRQLDNEALQTSREMTDRFYENIKLGGYNEDFVCSVFVSYVEIYNNYCYDLLEDSKNASLTKREIRHDRNQQTYVDGAKDVEVGSSEEALEIFCLGEERRRVSSTLLNKDSSRSHSVFTIKLVMAPRSYDSQTLFPVMDSSKIIVSQLCLVDLAGSERTKRTQNVGDRLAEASSINQSLMNLRQCLEILRRNQKNTQTFTEQVPFRQSKLTHLFKNYLEGNGKIRMIVCVNPKPEDYDENLSALGFAEESQNVEVKKQVDRVQTDRIPYNFNMQWNNEMDEAISNYPIAMPNMPTFCLRNYNDTETIDAIRSYANKLMTLTDEEDGSSDSLQLSIRQYMMEADFLRGEVLNLKETLEKKDEEIQKLRGFCSRYKRENQSLKQRVLNCEADEEEKVAQLDRLREQKMESERKLNSNNRALRAVREFVENPSPSVASLRNKFDNQENATAPVQTPPPPYVTPGRQAFRKRNEHNVVMATSSSGLVTGGGGHQGYVNPKYQRRSKSASRLLDHQPLHRVPTGTVLQSKTPSNAIRTTRPELHQLNKSAEYRLTHQEVDNDGNISTNIVKGDVIPTVGGGTSVFFNDIEKLTHESPMNRH